MELLTLERAAVYNVTGPEERELFPWDEIYCSVFSTPATREERYTQQLLAGLCCTSVPVEEAGMTHCCEVGWKWSSTH